MHILLDHLLNIISNMSILLLKIIAKRSFMSLTLIRDNERGAAAIFLADFNHLENTLGLGWSKNLEGGWN